MRLTILLFIALVLVACKAKTENPDAGLNEDMAAFEKFYTQFHEDPEFQLAHINFPLQGMPDNAANHPGYDENFRWSRENWVINKPLELEKNGFNRELMPIGNSMMIEKIIHSTGMHGMERRFAKMDGEWMLIYYIGINPVAK